MDERGVITAHGPFQGLDRFEARPAIVAALREQGRDRGREAAVRARRRPLLPVQDHRGAAAEPAVVRQHRPAGPGRRRRGARRPGPHRAGRAGQALLRLGRQHARLVHLPAAVVGAPDPGLVRPERRDGLRRPRREAARPARAGARTRTCSTPGSPRRCGRSPRWAGRTTPRTWRSSTRPACWSPGYDILFFWVARMMMFGLYAMDGTPAVRRRRPARHGARPARQEDVEVVRQRGRPAGLDRALRRRRHPVHPGPRGQPRRGRAGQRGVVPGLAQLLQQAVERDPVRADERGDRRRASCPRRTSCPLWTGGSCPGCST